MRTKALLGLAALAATALTASAQVYSLNVVGYYNVSIGTGYSMIANQLKASPDNTVATVLPNFPIGGSVLKWNGAGFDINSYYGDATWDDNTMTVAPGEGFFVQNNDAATTLTFVGEVPTGSLTQSMGTGYSLVASQVPQAGNLQVDMNLQPAAGDQILTWNGAGYDINAYYGDNTWDGDPLVTVGQGFFYQNNGGASVTWTRVFNP